MKKVVIMDEAMVMACLAKGLKVEGRLSLEETKDGRYQLRFQRYNRQAKRRPRARLLRVLEHGWVKESAQRIKVFESLPKAIGPYELCDVLDRETAKAEQTVVDWAMGLL